MNVSLRCTSDHSDITEGGPYMVAANTAADVHVFVEAAPAAVVLGLAHHCAVYYY